METERGVKIEKIIFCLFFLFFFASQAYFLLASASRIKEDKPTFPRWLVIEKGPWKLDWQTNSSENRPRINYEGEEVLLLSARESRISFPGLEDAGNFGLHEFGFFDDKDTIYNSYIGKHYAIEQINTIEEAGVSLKFFFSPFSRDKKFEDVELSFAFFVPSNEVFWKKDKGLIYWKPKDYLPLNYSLHEFQMRCLVIPEKILFERLKIGESKITVVYKKDKINQRVPLAEFLISD